MRSAIPCFSAAAMFVVLLSCHSGDQGTIQGTVTPAAAGARVLIKQGTAPVAALAPDERTGRFSISLSPGTYDVAVTSPAVPFPVSFPGVVVETGRSAALGTIEIAPVRATGSISGSVRGATAARVTLLANGRERASVVTDRMGRYELTEVPAGKYTVQVEAPNYAGDARSVEVAEGQRVALSIRMLYRTEIRGVDWSRGTIKARGVGSAPSQTANATARRELAKRAALADAERNLLRGLETVETGPGEKLSSFLGPRAYTQTLEGFIRGFHVTAERDFDDGKVEVEIELPVTGPGGLSSLLPAD